MEAVPFWEQPLLVSICVMKLKLIGALLVAALPVWGQQQARVDYRVEAVALAGDGEYAPLWFTANRYGTVGVAQKQASLRAGVFYQQELKRHWKVDAGVELLGGKNLVSNFWVHQAYADVAWKKLNLSIGSKERSGFPLEKNERLTSGWMVEGPNARPIPQVRMEVKDFWAIPGTKNWLAFKGHLAFGWFMDSNWQEDFVQPVNKFTKGALYQSKSLMFRLGNREKLPLELEFGILMGTQFGGEQYRMNADGRTELLVDMPDGMKAYWKAFFPQGGGSDNPLKGEQTNIEGNVLGSWNFALNWYLGEWKFRSYYEHYFEDHSQMFLEYGCWTDGQLGLEVNLPKNRWLSAVVWEGMCTKHQSGPFEAYSEYWPGEDFLLSGGDNYYNHGIYQAWQHYGLGLGNPLLPGPLYNEDGSIRFKSNRVRSNHVGLTGDPSEEWNWRVLASFARHWGTYSAPLDKQRKQFSGLAEVTYLPKWAKGWSASLALGLDRGNYLGNHTGGMLTLRKTGGFKL